MFVKKAKEDIRLNKVSNIDGIIPVIDGGQSIIDFKKVAEI